MLSLNHEKSEVNESIIFGDLVVLSYHRYLFLDKSFNVKNKSRAYLEILDPVNLINYKIYSNSEDDVSMVVEGMNELIGFDADIYYGPIFREIQDYILENILVSCQKIDDSIYLSYSHKKHLQ